MIKAFIAETFYKIKGVLCPYTCYMYCYVVSANCLFKFTFLCTPSTVSHEKDNQLTEFTWKRYNYIYLCGCGCRCGCRFGFGCVY